MGYQFIFEEEKCTGCFTCHTACMNAHYGVERKERSFRTVQQVVKEQEGYQKKICPGCLHCGECVKVCKSNAMYLDVSTGLVLTNREKCVGCKACEKICPMQVIRFDLDQKVTKCDGCIKLLKQEKEPACVRNCPVKAITVKERQGNI